MNPADLKMFMDMYGYPFGPSMSPFEFPKYPPSAMARFHMSPGKIKEKLIKENSTFSAKIEEFNKLYLKGASGLLDMNANPFPSGHPLMARTADYLLQNENMQLQKENAELRKRVEQMSKDKRHV